MYTSTLLQVYWYNITFLTMFWCFVITTCIILYRICFPAFTFSTEHSGKKLQFCPFIHYCTLALFLGVLQKSTVHSPQSSLRFVAICMLICKSRIPNPHNPAIQQSSNAQSPSASAQPHIINYYINSTTRNATTEGNLGTEYGILDF